MSADSAEPATPASMPELVGPARGLVVLVGLAATFVVVLGLKAASSLVGPAFLALVLTIAMHPIRRGLRRAHVPAWVATVLCILAVYAVLVSLSFSLVAATARFATLLPAYQSEFNALVAYTGDALAAFGVEQAQVRNVLDAFDVGKLTGVVTELLTGVLGVVSNLVFILTLVLFMTVDASTFPAHLSSTGPSRGRLVQALADFAVGTRSYLMVSTVFGFVVAVIDAAALALLGIPVPLLWGLLSFITNYIPNVGFVIGLVPPAVLALLEGGPGLCLAVVVVYALANLIIQTVIQPRFVGDAVGLSTTLTFLSLVFWAWVLGALGALLAIPLTLMAKALLIDVDPRTRWLVPLISNRPAPDDASVPGAPADT